MTASTNGSHAEPAATVVVELVERGSAQVAIVTLNRPDQHNPVDFTTIKALRRSVESITANADVRALVLTGAGPSFSAGGDLKGYQILYRDAEQFHAFLTEFSIVCGLLESTSFPTVAMVNGTCIAGGLELALACDVVVVAEHAQIGDGHLRFGQLPGAGGSQRLVRAIGVQRAKQWLLEGRLFSAAEAVAAGVAAYRFDAGELRERTLELCERMIGFSPLAFREMKRLVEIGTNTVRHEGLPAEQALVEEYATTSFDATEGIVAFAERRSPQYRGR